MEYLYNILYRKMITGYVLSPSDFKEITMFLVHYYQLDDYVKDVLFIDADHTLGEYTVSKKKITYNCFYMDSCIKRLFIDFQCQQYRVLYNYFYLFYQLDIILHEIRHVIQYKKMNSYVSEKHDYIISSVIKDSLTMKEDKYSHYYRICPIEKDASLFGFSKAFSLFRTLMNRDSNDNFLRMIKSQYNFQIFNGYHNFQKGSLKDFYHLALKRDFLYKRYEPFVSSLTTYDKLSFNFDLSREDLNRITNFLQNREIADPIKTLSKKA